MSKRLLEGIKVVDITLAYAGPVCAMHLADHGAEVIKVEPLGGEQTRTWGPFYNDYSGYYAYFNRNKYGMAIDMKSEEGKEAIAELIKGADVLVQNMRVGTLDRLGFSYEVCKELNPRLIYASVSGFGPEGPDSYRPTYDYVAQAESGMMWMTGTPESGPLKIGPSVADSYTGTYLALGIAMALYNRERTGEGMELDCAMVDTMFGSLENWAMNYFLLGEDPDNSVNTEGAYAPWDSFHAKDGMYVIACGTYKHFSLLMEAIGMPELATDPRFESDAARAKNYLTPGGLKEIIENWGADKTREEIGEIILGAGVPWGQVKSVGECAESEQTKVRNMVWEYDDPNFGKTVKMPGSVIKFHGRPDEIIKPSPALGEDNDKVLREIGYSQEKIDELRALGIIL